MEYRKALALVSIGGRVAVWEQIDRILEVRYVILAKGLADRAAANIPEVGSTT